MVWLSINFILFFLILKVTKYYVPDIYLYYGDMFLNLTGKTVVIKHMPMEKKIKL